MTHHREKNLGSNCALTWEALSALGTLLAVGVALYLARSDYSRQKEVATVRARLSAASMTYRLKTTHDAIDSCIARVVFGGTDTGSANEVLLALSEIKKVLSGPLFEPSPDDLVPLITLENSCAHRIARSTDLIGTVRESARDIDVNALSSTQAAQLLDHWLTILKSASELLGAALMVCEKASEKGAPDLTPEERTGPEFDT